MLNIGAQREEELFKAVKLVVSSVVNGFNDAREIRPRIASPKNRKSYGKSI